MSKPAQSCPKRVYVKVDSRFDETGTMVPTSLIWGDGRIYKIDGVRDYRPARSMIGDDLSGDCYTVLINGREKHLFFEKTDPRFTSKVGRWFVEYTT